MGLGFQNKLREHNPLTGTDLKVDWIVHLLSVYNKKIEAGSQAHFSGWRHIGSSQFEERLIHFTIEKLLFSQIITI